MSRDTLSKVVALTASATGITALVIYYMQTYSGEVRPSITSWALWSFLIALNVKSYYGFSQDIWKILTEILGFFACIVVCVLALRIGKFTPLDIWDYLVIAISCVAMLRWYQQNQKTGGASDASWQGHFILQFALLVSFVPTFRNVLADPTNESFWAWGLWTVMYSLNLIIVALRWKGQKKELLTYSRAFVLHVLVFLLTVPAINKFIGV